jgi:hypothetical protein
MKIHLYRKTIQAKKEERTSPKKKKAVAEIAKAKRKRNPSAEEAVFVVAPADVTVPDSAVSACYMSV